MIAPRSTLGASTRIRNTIDNTDWLKTAAIIVFTIDHFGYFFIENVDWWSAVGRLSAPPFFFLLGYAQSRTVPLRWLWLGIGLTVLDSWNNDWEWMAPNILFSLAAIRLMRPYVQMFMERYGWLAFVLLVAGLIAMLPVAGKVVDYGAQGWMWALFGFLQRASVDRQGAAEVEGSPDQSTSPPLATVNKIGLMRLIGCLITVVVFVWQEQKEFLFPEIQLAFVFVYVGAFALAMTQFKRGAARIQPPAPVAAAMRFIGRYTLELYALQLASFELTILLRPDLAG